MMPLKGHGDRKNMRWEVKLNINAFTFSHKKMCVLLINFAFARKTCKVSQEKAKVLQENKVLRGRQMFSSIFSTTLSL